MMNSCANAEKESPAKEVINVDSLAVNPFQYSSYFEQIDYVPLEASKESLIGYVHNIHVYDEMFFVLDISTAKRLFIFDLNGT
ncbi:MAG: 6-bladed beta-propeller, partial [Bacteroidota bacterium]